MKRIYLLSAVLSTVMLGACTVATGPVVQHTQGYQDASDLAVRDTMVTVPGIQTGKFDPATGVLELIEKPRYDIAPHHMATVEAIFAQRNVYLREVTVHDSRTTGNTVRYDYQVR